MKTRLKFSKLKLEGRDLKNNSEPFILWGLYEEGKTFDSFCSKIIPNFSFNNSVPKTIINRFGTIRKLLEYSYYEYDFIDVALEKCYHTLELALHLKYISENPRSNREMTLKPLIDWAVRENHLKITKEQNKSITFLRNHLFHPKDDTSLGIVAFPPINVIGNKLINGLFK